MKQLSQMKISKAFHLFNEKAPVYAKAWFRKVLPGTELYTQPRKQVLVFHTNWIH
ncbi:hypothetical protein ACFLS7_02810 [Bacteroidota bacterium]